MTWKTMPSHIGYWAFFCLEQELMPVLSVMWQDGLHLVSE